MNTKRFQTIFCLFALGGVVLAYVGPSKASSMWPSGGRAMAEILENGGTNSRRAVVVQLATTPLSVARPLIVQALLDSDIQVRLSAASLLIARRLPGAESILLQWLGSGVLDERLLAAEVLGREPKGRVLLALGRALADSSPDLRRIAAQGLGRAAGTEQGRASSFLVRGLHDDALAVRLAVVRALGSVAAPRSASSLAAYLQDPEESVRSQVALALGVIGERRVAPALVVALSDENDNVVIAAAQSLGSLGYHEALPALKSLFSASSTQAIQEAAANALAQIGGAVAWAALLEQLLAGDNKHLLDGVLLEYPQESQAILEMCVQDSIGETLEQCARGLLQVEGSVEALLTAWRQGRLGEERLFSLFNHRKEKSVVVLALEALGRPLSSSSELALSYLESLTDVPSGAWEPLVNIVKKQRWSPQDTSRLLLVMARVSGKRESLWGREFLDSTSPLVQGAAAYLLVSEGLAGNSLEELLLQGERDTVEGALLALSRGSSVAQAQVLVSIVARGASGRRDRIIEVFFAFPAHLTRSTTLLLGELLSTTRGPQRDLLLNGLARNGDFSLLKRIGTEGAREDRRKLAQLAIYHPEGARLARLLTKDLDARTSASALYALGALGDSTDASLIGSYARSLSKGPRPVPRFVQASALLALRLLRERGKLASLPDDLLSNEVCSSPHVALRRQALRLAHSFGKACDSQSLTELLLQEPQPFIRQTAAQLLDQSIESLRILRRCSIYEMRAEVATSCRARLAALTRGKVRSMPSSTTGVSKLVSRGGELVPGASLPFQLVTIKKLTGGLPARLQPVSFRIAEHDRVFIADRLGQILLPTGEYRRLDASLSY